MNSWKTTLAGILTAATTIVVGYLTTGKIDPAQATQGLGLIIAFLLSKDHDVTGGVS
jgi:hypothetical protein